MTTIQGIHHAQVTIPKGEEAAGRAFYCELLGLPEIEKPDALKHRGGFWVQVGALQLHIGTEDGEARRQTKAHVAYQVENLSAWQQKLTDYGIVFEEAIPIVGYIRLQFRDPFGNRVEFLEPIA